MFTINAMYYVIQEVKSIKDTRLIFVDDLLLFSMGDIDSIQVVMQQFQNFSRSFDLIDNAYKSELYYVRVNN